MKIATNMAYLCSLLLLMAAAAAAKKAAVCDDSEAVQALKSQIKVEAAKSKEKKDYTLLKSLTDELKANQGIDGVRQRMADAMHKAGGLEDYDTAADLQQRLAAIDEASSGKWDSEGLYWAAKEGDFLGVLIAIKQRVALDELTTRHEVDHPLAQESATALMVAAEYGDAPIVEALLKAGAEADLQDEAGITALLLAAAGYGNFATIDALVKGGAKADQQYRADGVAPLFMAAQRGNLEGVEALLGAGASVDQMTEEGNWPLFTAAQFGQAEAVRALVLAGADLSISMASIGWSPLFVAAWSGHAAVVAELLQHAPDRSAATTHDYLDVPAGSTALSVAHQHNNHDVVQLLLA